MGIIHTKGIITFSDVVDGSTAASLYSDIISLLNTTLWSGASIALNDFSFATAAYGFVQGTVYTITSPQLLADGVSQLKAKVYVWIADRVANPYGVQHHTSWNSGNPLVWIMFGDEDGNIMGMPHGLRTETGITYYVWANCCSLFIHRSQYSRCYKDGVEVALSETEGGYSVCGGIPFVQETSAGDCGVMEDVPQLTDLWWDSGDSFVRDSGPSWRSCFRNSLWSEFESSSGSVNLDLFTSDVLDVWTGPNSHLDLEARYAGGPQLLVWPVVSLGFIYYTCNARTRFWDPDDDKAVAEGMTPFIGWPGTQGVHEPKLRGVIFDALLTTVPQVEGDLVINGLDMHTYSYDPKSPKDGEAFVGASWGAANADNSFGSRRTLLGSLVLYKSGEEFEPPDPGTGVMNYAY